MAESVCEVDALYRSACEGAPVYDHGGGRYCVLHCPSGYKKAGDLQEAVGNKLARGAYDFSGTIFTEGVALFEGFEFDEDVSFAGATFWMPASFKAAKFGGQASFRGATFRNDVDFFEAEFRGRATYFVDAVFRGLRTSFRRATFGGDTRFSGTQFMEGSVGTDFSETVFGGERTMLGAKFNGSAIFSGTRFDGETHFSGATFRREASFQNARFNGKTLFGVDFYEFLDFREVQVSGEIHFHLVSNQLDFHLIDFSQAKLSGEVDFSKNEFTGTTSFHKAEFSGEVNFSQVKFSLNTDFSGTQFSGKRTDFSGAQFSGGPNFREATFNNQPDFQDTTFEDATFENTTFQYGADFTGAKFQVTSKRTTDFRRATFGGELYFREAEFDGDTDFYRANFLDAVKFIGGVRNQGRELNPVFHPDGQVSFTRARMDKPELFSFDTVDLRSSWLVGVDARKFDFTDVKWYGMPGGLEGTFDEEIAALEKRGVEPPHTLLAQACRRLSANAEDNHEYPLANEFHYWSMDALRKEGWTRLGLIGTLYWALSGYGVRAARAFLVLVGLWFLFTTLYVLVHSSPFSFSEFGQAAAYSLSALVRLNPRPQSEELNWFQTLVTIEGILGPLQIGLLLLAIRRKVMR